MGIVEEEDRAVKSDPPLFEVRRGDVLSPEMLFHVPPHGPRNKEKVVPDSGAHGGNRAFLPVIFQRVLLFRCQNVLFHAVRGGVLRFKDDGAPARKRPLKIPSRLFSSTLNGSGVLSTEARPRSL